MRDNFLTRIAPTPSGYIHLGNACSFALTQLLAKEWGAKLLLRIDDLDRSRYRREYVQSIFTTLETLQITPDYGPSGVEDFEKNWSQRHRMRLYVDLLERLKQKGLIFAAGESRSQLAVLDGDGYPDSWINQSIPLDAKDVVWRVKTMGRVMPANFVVGRRDGVPAYQIASLADDLHFGVSHIVRGVDLEQSTNMQRYLAQQLDETAFLNATFIHHPLLLTADGVKISKSAGASAVFSQGDLRENKNLIWEIAEQWKARLGF